MTVYMEPGRGKARPEGTAGEAVSGGFLEERAASNETRCPGRIVHVPHTWSREVSGNGILTGHPRCMKGMHRKWT